MRRSLYTGIVFILLVQFVYGQQYPDRHNTSVNSSWISCETKMSPNPDRGSSHWIQYEFDTTYALGASTFWNLNAYGYTESGVSDVVIDYSLDGFNWIEWGDYALERAEAISTYEGEHGPDFDGIIAKYLLITSRGNFGGDCHGFSEFRVSSSPAQISNTTNHELAIGISAQPNPFVEQSRIVLTNLPKGTITYQLSNTIGKVIKTGTIIGNELLIAGDGLSGGLYTVTLYHTTGTKTIQLTRIN